MMIDLKNQTLEIPTIQKTFYHSEWFNDFKQLNIIS